MRLSGWQKIGVALSILWAVAAGIHTRNADVERAENFAKFSYKVCSDSKMIAGDTDLRSCEQAKQGDIDTFMVGSNGNVAFAALAPVPVGWIACYILIYLGRIQLAGFKATFPWSTMSRRKKAFVVLCGAGLAVSLLFASMSVMNLYVDTEVPVALAPIMDVFNADGEMVSVRGTWTRHGATDKSSLAFPLQTSAINCIRSDRRCTEARASVSGNLLTSELVEYEVQSWTKSSIVMRNDGVCAEEIYTIDLNTKAVSGAGRRINNDTPLCKLSPSDETEWSYRMEKGFPIYWDLRMKARPLPLRVIQSFFGH